MSQQDLNEFAGLGMALIPFTYSKPVKQADGSFVYLPHSLTPGETFPLQDLGERDRIHLKEGADYAVSFNQDDVDRVRTQGEANYLSQFAIGDGDIGLRGRSGRR
jgi:hypothetical protein